MSARGYTYGPYTAADGVRCISFRRVDAADVPTDSWSAMMRWFMRNPWVMVQAGGWTANAQGHSRYVGGVAYIYDTWMYVCDASTASKRSKLQYAS